MPGMLTARWRVESDHFGEYKRRIHQSAEVAGERLARRGERRAKEVASSRVRSGAMREGIRFETVVEPSGRVRVVGADPVWYSHFQDRGTKRGVSPLLFLEQGLAVAADASFEEIRASTRGGILG